MIYKTDGYNWLVRLDRGELLIDTLTRLFKENDLPSVWLSGIGGAAWAELAFYNLDSQKYRINKINKLLEITSLQGNAAWEGDQPLLHIHGTFADERMHGLGGHINELEVAGTCEILLHRWYGDQLNRIKDQDTGLKLLDI